MALLLSHSLSGTQAHTHMHTRLCTHTPTPTQTNAHTQTQILFLLHGPNPYVVPSYFSCAFLSLSLAHTLSHTHNHTHSPFLSLSLVRNLTPRFCLSVSLTHSPPLFLFLFLALSLSLSPSLSLSLSLSRLDYATFLCHRWAFSVLSQTEKLSHALNQLNVSFIIIIAQQRQQQQLLFNSFQLLKVNEDTI